MRAPVPRAARRATGVSRLCGEAGWYHSFELPSGARIEGAQGLDLLRKRFAEMPLPQDLAGRRILDIGAWDGWFSFEAERRGAEVTAVDCVEAPTFLQLHEQLGSRVRYRILDVFELPRAGLGRFDYVLFLGVLYHLKHPFLALEIVCGLTGELAIVESYVVDGDRWTENREALPWLEFYEAEELGGQLDNWYGPSVGCLLAMCRAAGFARVELLSLSDQRACLACWRTWEPPPAEPPQPAPLLTAIINTRNYGLNFSTSADEYMTWWFETPEENLSRDALRLEVGGFALPAMYLEGAGSNRWQVNSRVPPGLDPGWRQARLRTSTSGYSNTVRVAVDMPPRTDGLILESVCDGVSWERNQVRAVEQGFLSLWARGLAENCDRNNVRVHLGRRRLAVEFIGPPDGTGLRQVNLRLPAGTPKGEHPLVVQFGEAACEPVLVRVL